MRVVVVGATGNVGTSLLRSLADDPEVDSVLALARRSPGIGFPKTQWGTVDVARATDLADRFAGADAVVHLAWLIQPGRDLETLYATNVEGSRRVFQAAVDAGVPALVYASSVGAYAPGPKDRAVDESWPTTGLETSTYARHKAEVERILDRIEAEAPALRAVRLRPGLIFKRDAASEIRRLFAGPFLPSPLVRPGLIPAVPDDPRLVFQAVHSLDAGEAYRLAVKGDVRGAFNIAAEPVLDPDELGRILGARPVPVPAKLLRIGADLSWRTHLQPTPPGWVDLAVAAPVLDTGRARRELGWQPTRTAGEALRELLDGIADRASYPTPALAGSGWRAPGISAITPKPSATERVS